MGGRRIIPPRGTPALTPAKACEVSSCPTRPPICRRGSHAAYRHRVYDASGLPESSGAPGFHTAVGTLQLGSRQSRRLVVFPVAMVARSHRQEGRSQPREKRCTFVLWRPETQRARLPIRSALERPTDRRGPENPRAYLPVQSGTFEGLISR